MCGGDGRGEAQAEGLGAALLRRHELLPAPTAPLAQDPALRARLARSTVGLLRAEPVESKTCHVAASEGDPFARARDAKARPCQAQIA